MPITRIIYGSLGFCILAYVAIYTLGPRLKKTFETTVVDHVMDSFSDETAQTRFMSYATTVTPLKRLELAKINQLEIFERTSHAKLFWEKMNLPEVVIRATVPVEYRYYVELDKSWQVTMKGEVLNVVAPSLYAGTPAPDISKLRFEVRKGSFFRNEVQVAQDLQNEITGMLENRAKESSILVRESARQQIAQLIKQWLSSESKQGQIFVRFADEAPSAP